jgi:hypothetical protein
VRVRAIAEHLVAGIAVRLTLPRSVMSGHMPRHDWAGDPHAGSLLFHAGSLLLHAGSLLRTSRLCAPPGPPPGRRRQGNDPPRWRRALRWVADRHNLWRSVMSGNGNMPRHDWWATAYGRRADGPTVRTRRVAAGAPRPTASSTMGSPR